MNAMIMTEKPQELTVSEVSERLGISYRRALRRIAQGKIRARLEGNEYRIREADLQAYIERTFRENPPEK